MNNKRKFFTALHDHTDLLAIFSGMVATALAVIALAIAGGIWYL